jgi:hypothetical protein
MKGIGKMSLTKRYLEAQTENATDAVIRRARQSVKSALRNVTITEGRLLDFETADEITRALDSAARDMEALALTVAVMERRIVNA